MQDSIRELVQMDRAARSRMEQIHREGEEARRKIQENRGQVYEQYLEKAQKRVHKIQEATQEQEAALEAQADAEYREAKQSLDRCFQDNRERWVEEIYRRCVTPAAQNGR